MELPVEEIIYAILTFFLGASLSSFLYLLAERFIDHYYSKKAKVGWKNFAKDLLVGRSICNKCKRVLTVLDLIPVFNPLFNRGKCPKCGYNVPLKYFMGEVILGLAFVFLFIKEWQGELNLTQMVYPVLILSILFFFSVLDLEAKKVPNLIIYPIIFIFALTNISVENILAAVSGACFIWLVIILTGGKGFGFGDLKYVMALGFLLGRHIIAALFLAVVLAALFGVVNAFDKSIRGKKRLNLKNQYVPFVPFLSFGAVVMYIGGDYIWEKYFAFDDILLFISCLINGSCF